MLVVWWQQWGRLIWVFWLTAWCYLEAHLWSTPMCCQDQPCNPMLARLPKQLESVIGLRGRRVKFLFFLALCNSLFLVGFLLVHRAHQCARE